MMKPLLLILHSLVLSLTASASDLKIHVIMKSGQQVQISLAETPKIVFENGVMYVGSQDFLISNVSKYIIGDETAGVNNPTAGELALGEYDATKGIVRISNYNGEAIKLYTTNGMEVPCHITKNGITATIDLSEQPAGVYLLNIGKETIKISKR